MSQENKIYDAINPPTAPYIYRDYKEIELMEKYRHLTPMNILLLGVTGAGKSSTINALFGKNIVKVGEGVDPETKRISPVNFNAYMTLYDSPGFGDGLFEDKQWGANVLDVLNQRIISQSNIENFRNIISGRNFNNDTNAQKGIKKLCSDLVHKVLIIIEGSSRDLGVIYSLISKILYKNNLLGSREILIAINKADIAMSGRYWDTDKNEPEKILADFLDEKALSVQKRIIDTTGVNVPLPVCYSARKKWNLTAVLDLLYGIKAISEDETEVN
ncbi:MAG: 50S ribosome-binding GTPase [Prolixibacteraceae bacterium]|nr:50S ribosome-binding GTPase [Prolixibacteraceae bacterium]